MSNASQQGAVFSYHKHGTTFEDILSYSFIVLQ